MGKKIGSEKIDREDGYLYYLGKDGYVWKSPMKHNKKGKKGKRYSCGVCGLAVTVDEVCGFVKGLEWQTSRPIPSNDLPFATAVPAVLGR